MSSMSFDDAVAALDSAMEADGMVGGNPASTLELDTPFFPANDGPSQGGEQTPTATPETPAAPVAPAVEAEPFTEKFDPNTLPPELLPAYKSMQADYTRKTQGLAERARQFEQYGDLDIETAVELMQRVSDPQGLQAFISEASGWLEEQGFTPAQARVAATQAAQDAADGPAGDPFAGLDALAANDPELAPLAQAVRALQAQVSNIDQDRADRLAAERAQAQELQVLGELQRMENFIRSENPQYTDADVEAIYELGAFYDGNLIQAQQAYEARFADRLGRYLAAKDVPAGAPSVQPLGIPVGQPEGRADYNPLDPKQAHEAAMELLRHIEANE